MIVAKDKKNKVRLGFVGLGNRCERVLLDDVVRMSDVEVSYICDINPERVKFFSQTLESLGKKRPAVTSDYREMLKSDIDAVMIMTGWGDRCRIAMDFMRAGIYTAIEVGCAYSVDECYKLVEAYETYGTPVMMLENCCYGRRELMALNMERMGLFGEIVHASGTYSHDLRARELHLKGYRYDEYRFRNCDGYPTHEFGPLSKLLRINRGNRIVSLASFSSKAEGLNEYMKAKHQETVKARQGDIITTVLTLAGGETVTLSLDTTLPRPHYSRGFTVRGTKGCIIEECESSSVFLEGMEEGIALNESEMLEKYEHPLQRENMERYRPDWHRDNIDWLVVRAFIEAVKAGTDTPIDAYDTAVWLAIGPVSEESLARGSVPVPFPDFTRGAWMHREGPVLSKYCLDKVVEDEKIKVFEE